jgi:hypothetical protein
MWLSRKGLGAHLILPCKPTTLPCPTSTVLLLLLLLLLLRPLWQGPAARIR